MSDELLFNGQTGWICPQCGKVWGPLMVECFECNQQLASTPEPARRNLAMEQSLEHIIERARTLGEMANE